MLTQLFSFLHPAFPVWQDRGKEKNHAAGNGQDSTEALPATVVASVLLVLPFSRAIWKEEERSKEFPFVHLVPLSFCCK